MYRLKKDLWVNGLLLLVASGFIFAGLKTSAPVIVQTVGELTHQCGIDFENDLHMALLIEDCAGCHAIDGEARHSAFRLSKSTSYAGAVFNEAAIFGYENPLMIIDKMEGINHGGGQIADRTDKRFQRLEYFVRSYLATEGRLN